MNRMDWGYGISRVSARRPTTASSRPRWSAAQRKVALQWDLLAPFSGCGHREGVNRQQQCSMRSVRRRRLER
jgi:hypothetical protein